MAKSPLTYSEKTVLFRPNILQSPWMIPLLSVLILAVLFSLRLIADFDIGFHLRGGEWIIQNKSFFQNDPYTYTVSDHPYIDLHWLYQLFLYGIYSLFNYEGVELIHSLTLLTSLAVLVRVMGLSGLPVGWTTAGLLTMVVISEGRFNTRPEIFSWLWLVSVIYIIEAYVRDHKKSLFMLPLLMIVWVNMQGIFVLGLVVMVGYGVSTFFYNGTDKYYLKWAGLSVLAVFVNPYHFHGVVFPFELFSRFQSENIFKGAITEFLPSWTANTLPYPALGLNTYYAYSVAGALAMLVTFKNRKLHEWLLYAAFFYLSYSQVRNIPLFAIVSLPWITRSIFELTDIIKKKLAFRTRIPAWWGGVVICLVSVFIGARVVTDAYYIEQKRSVRFGIGLDEEYLPVHAAEFLNGLEVHGRMMNNLNIGGWLIWAWRNPVFIDGRLEVIGEDVFRWYRQSLRPTGLPSLISQVQPEIIAYDYNYAESWTPQLKKMRDWQLIYFDENSCIYVKSNSSLALRGLSPDPIFSRNGVDTSDFTGKKTRIFSTPQKGKWKRWVNGFYEKQVFLRGMINMALFSELQNDLKTAELLYVNFLARDDGNHAEVFYNLAQIYELMRDYDGAITCYQKYLEAFPGSAVVMRKLNSAALQRRVLK